MRSSRKRYRPRLRFDECPTCEALPPLPLGLGNTREPVPETHGKRLQRERALSPTAADGEPAHARDQCCKARTTMRAGCILLPSRPDPTLAGASSNSNLLG